MDPVDSILAIATILLVVITGIGILKSNHNTQKSNKMLKKDIEARTRPILVRNVPHDWKYIREGLLAFRFKNVGNLPATNIIIKWYIGLGVANGDRRFFNSSDIHFVDYSPSSLGPTEEINIPIYFGMENQQKFLDRCRDSDVIEFGLLLEYEGEGKEYEYKIEGRVDRSQIIVSKYGVS